MTDKDLLKLAAKAAKYKINKYPGLNNRLYCSLIGTRLEGSLITIDRYGIEHMWNPLLFDYDAFELAIKLQIPFKGKTTQSARRSIVKAAAKIGKALCPSG